MPKTPQGQPSQRKTQDAVAARLKPNQQRANMAQGDATRQNQRVTKKIINQGKGLKKSK